jgi:hypothetical protein
MLRSSILFIALFTLVSTGTVKAQGLNFGIRAGLNYASFLGDKTPEESRGLTNGFHFGINVGYELNDLFFLRGEILYTQQGTSYEYSGDGYYIFNTLTDGRFVIQDSTNVKLDISNAYVSIPLTAHISALEKWEFHAGAYVSFLVSPIGAGTLRFGSRENVNHIFEQGLNFNYRSDEPAESNIFAQPILLIVNGQDASVPDLVGAYYLFQEDRGNFINKLDYGITGGVSYFLNRGLYVGLKGWYGLKDITNNAVDYSLSRLNPDGSFQYSDDFDRNLNIDVSIGFKF